MGNKKRAAARFQQQLHSDVANGIGLSAASEKNKESDAEVIAEESCSKDGFVIFNIRNVALMLIAIVFAVVHRYHVSMLFENDRHFSHLSSLEREMTFRTEMGLYYSYYKTIIEARSWWEGIDRITHDNITEFPDTINTLRRFNLYPEVVLGGLYRAYVAVADYFQWKIKECWRTDRGQGLGPIISCEGMGDPFYFYINGVFALAGITAASLFLHGVLLSDSVLGGVVAVASFFFNHGECTRVQWTPPLRESFSYPLLAVQSLLVCLLVKHFARLPVAARRLSLLGIAVLTAAAMMCWQFCGFALGTQIAALFVTFSFTYIDSRTLSHLSRSLLAGFALGFIALCGNTMLLTSLFLCGLIAAQLCLAVHRWIPRRTQLVYSLTHIAVFAAVTIALRIVIANLLDIADDAHVFAILKAKFTDYSDFHTKLYTCAPEFDFMLPETPWKLSYTLLLPSAAVAVCLSFYQIAIKQELPNLLKPAAKIEKQFPEVVFGCFQLVQYTLMAWLIMRLKLFWTPHLCLTASLLASRRLLQGAFGRQRAKWLFVQAAVIGLLSAMAVRGVQNIRDQHKIIGEYSNPAQEDLFGWIERNTSPTAVFAGPMPTMANVKLSCGRPVVNHPHYEDANLRRRNMLVYSMFSRRSPQRVFETMRQLRVDYVVFEGAWCNKGGKPGCSLPELWDLHDVELRGQQSLCDRFWVGDFGAFQTPVFHNQQYMVFLVGAGNENQKRV